MITSKVFHVSIRESDSFICTIWILNDCKVENFENE